MKTSSAKAKGRRCAQQAKDMLLKASGRLEEDDITVTPSGVTGPDLHLSPAALKQYPFAVECKNVEKLNVWEALSQSEDHAMFTNKVPILIFTRNRSDTYVALKFSTFLELYAKRDANPAVSGSVDSDEQGTK